MILPLFSTFLIATAIEARVTFTHSEVLQATDLANNRASFKCDNGCNAYTDFYSDKFFIVELNPQKNTYTDITSMDKIGGGVKGLPDPFKLEKSNNYFIETRGVADPKFVFYVVDTNAPNIGTAVLIIDDDWGVDGNIKDQSMFTVLTSKYESIRYNQFDGEFLQGYPRIYSTGFDAVGDNACKPMYTGRSPGSVSLAAITVFSPISTVDFGFNGDHNVHAAWNKDNRVVGNGHSSTVFTSPGYVGCSNVHGQSYSSSLDTVGDGFELYSYGLDVTAVTDHVTTDEIVNLQLDEVLLTFSGTETNTKSYPHTFFDFAVAVNWKRATPTSSWAIQIDFGTGDGEVSTTPKTIDSTTSNAGLKAIFMSIIVVFFALL